MESGEQKANDALEQIISEVVDKVGNLARAMAKSTRMPLLYRVEVEMAKEELNEMLGRFAIEVRRADGGK